jgi:hypothetical protein
MSMQGVMHPRLTNSPHHSTYTYTYTQPYRHKYTHTHTHVRHRQIHNTYHSVLKAIG